MAEASPTAIRRFTGSWHRGGWFLRIGLTVYALKAPWYPAIWSERNRRGVRVLPLGFGWRLTARKVSSVAIDVIERYFDETGIGRQIDEVGRRLHDRMGSPR